jgi:NAD(P)-dependent dehydrogenase (short-subunit alcohol dehydrogenase family)
MPEPLRHHNRLSGKVAIVTGAGSQGSDEAGVGTGKAIAVCLAAEGAAVCLVDRVPERAQDTLQRIESAGGKAFICAADVTLWADCERVVAETVERFGGLDILVNNVGVTGAPGGFETFNEADWSRVMDINLKSAVLMSRAAVPSMLKRGAGSIVNISSLAGQLAHGSGFAYGPSKAAMGQLSAELAVTYGRQGIRANTVAPGHIVTPLSAGLTNPGLVAARRKVAPLGVEGDAWDVAGATVFLVSDEARFITGALIPVDGGVSMIGPLAAYGMIMRPD